MNCIFSIKKQYSDLIFNKTKPIEFRNRLPKLEKDDKVYIYETKSQGCGKVVGYFIVDSTKKIKHNKIGTYIYMDLYADLFCDEETKRLVHKAKSINLENHYNDLVTSYLFMEDCLDEMLKTNNPPRIYDSYYLKNDNFRKLQQLEQKQTCFLSDCDEWLRKIGFYDDYDYSNWEYEIRIKDVFKFEKPIDITCFQLRNGNYLKSAPQSFCYTNSNF